MQSPTPPTKPIPPTPPSMTKSVAVPSSDTHVPATTSSQSLPSKVVSTPKEQSAPIPTSVPPSINNIPPLASFSTATNTSTETTSQSALPSTTKLPKASSSSTGFSMFFVLIFIISIGLVAVHWWKNHKPNQGSIVDYSTESSKEIVNLILSQNILESEAQVLPKKITKKIVPQAEAMPKTKGNFEVRI